MRPVDLLAIASGSAKQRVDGNSKRLALDVPEGEFDAGDCLGSDATGRLPRHAVQVPVAGFDSKRVLAFEQRQEVGYRTDYREGIAAIRHLPVPGDALVGPYRAELPRTPSSVNNESIDCGDFHVVSFWHRACRGRTWVPARAPRGRQIINLLATACRGRTWVPARAPRGRQVTNILASGTGRAEAALGCQIYPPTNSLPKGGRTSIRPGVPHPDSNPCA